MNEPIPWIFFCTETDYPKFFSLLSDIFPPTYGEFIAGIDKSIADVMEQYTIVKTNVGFEEFIAYCAVSGKEPNYDSLLSCTFQAWGRNWQS